MLVRSPEQSVPGVEHVIDVACFLVPDTYLQLPLHVNHSGKLHVSPGRKERPRQKIGTQGVHVSTACVCRGIKMPCGFGKRL